MNKSPYEIVKEHYTLPIELYPLQAVIVNALAPVDRNGEYAQVGTGKTPMSTVIALYRSIVFGYKHTIVAMPPILLLGWYRWLSRIPGVTASVYAGEPKERRKISLDKDFILMSIQIFKKDNKYLTEYFEHLKVQGIVDEATSNKNVTSANYKMTRDFYVGRPLQLLTGTPLTTPGDAYAYVKCIAPTVYRNQNHFEAVHVEKKDFFDKVVKWCNLDLLAENMLINSVRVLKSDMFPGYVPPTYQSMPYTLDAQHQALYRRLGEEQMLILLNGGKIDATTGPKLFQAMQQIVLNPAHFSGDPSMRAAGVDLLDQVLVEVGVAERLPNGKLIPREGGSKLVVYANYKMTMRMLTEYIKPFGGVSIYGEVSSKNQSDNLRRFIDDPKCGVLAANPISAGYGVDGMQQVCSNALFLEAPITPKDFEQGVGRLDRDGQKEHVTVRVAIAEGTIQVRRWNDLMQTDALANRVQGGFQDLRDAIFGS